jgi:hypothetical protein
LTSLSGTTLVAHWYDPRTGTSRYIGSFPRTAETITFMPPGIGPDWVLVLDDAERGYPIPGK